MSKKHYTSAISALFGRFASKEFPSVIQHIINAGYVKLMGLGYWLRPRSLIMGRLKQDLEMSLYLVKPGQRTRLIGGL
jgi:hypothetical protein